MLPSPQGTRKGHPYHGRMALATPLASMVGVPLAGTLGAGCLAYVRWIDRESCPHIMLFPFLQ